MKAIKLAYLEGVAMGLKKGDRELVHIRDHTEHYLSDYRLFLLSVDSYPGGGGGGGGRWVP